MEAEQAPPPSSSAPSSSSSAPSSSSSAPSSSSSITDSVPTSSSPFLNVALTSSPSFSTTLVSATTTTMATSTATSDTTATVTTTATTTATTQMIDIPPILGATATTTTSTGETNSLTSTSISSSTTAPTAATTISTTTTTITTSPFSNFDHQPPSNALPLRPSFPINRNRPQMPPPIPPPHFAQHLPSPSPPPLPFSSSSPASSSSVGVPSLLASSSSSSSSLSSSSSSSSSPSPPPSATSPSSSSSPLQRGGLAIGVPAYPPRPQSTSLLPSSTFGSPPFGHQLGSLGRISDQTQSASPQVRPGMQGIQTIGMMGALSGSQIRPGAAAAHLPPRPAQQQLRPQSPSSNQPSAPQKQQGPGLSRVSSFGPSNSQPPSMPHSPQSHTQPWMSTQGRSVPASVLSSASYRPQFRSSILQQRSTNTQQQQNPMAVAPQQQQQQNVSSQQQQQQQQPPQQQQQQQQPQQNTSQMQHAAENYPQMHQPSRMHPVLQPQQGLRPQGSVQKSIASPSVPSAHHGSLASTKASEAVETGNQILSKRSIHELLSQIDPLERLDPEVEDVLAEIADDFVESITTFACSLAKHRKSTTLESKDILLHMERNWNMTFPGFSADEIKIFKKPPVNDIHKQRMVAIKKSYITTQAMAETANVKGSSGQVPGNVKGHPGKGPAMTSPKT